MMELVDVVDSKSTAGDSVPVRVRSPAPKQKATAKAVAFCFGRNCECPHFSNYSIEKRGGLYLESLVSWTFQVFTAIALLFQIEPNTKAIFYIR